MEPLDALDLLDTHLQELHLLMAQAAELRLLVDAHERSVMEACLKVQNWRSVAENALLHAYGLQE
jgi:hypothetical protein